MPLNMSSDAQALFYEKVFGKDSPEMQTVTALIQQGFTFETSLFTCKVHKGIQKFQVSLSHGSNSLVKGTVPPMQAALNKKKISDWLQELNQAFLKGNTSTFHPAPSEKAEIGAAMASMTSLVTLFLTGFTPGDKILTIKIIREATNFGLKEAKDLVEQAQAGKSVVLGAFTQEKAQEIITKLQMFGATAKASTGSIPIGVVGVGNQVVGTTPVLPTSNEQFNKAQKVPHPILLREAQVVGQPVKGTSAGSVYHCVALNNHIRLAARILKSGSISIRAEWEGKLTTEENAKLTALGLIVKGDYASMHISADGVPPERILGAIIMGSGLQWQQSVTSAQELVVE